MLPDAALLHRKITDISFGGHQIFTREWQVGGVMNEQLTAKVQCWGGRAVAVMGYLATLGMIAAGLSLMGFALLVGMFTHAEGIAVMCMLSGTVFTALGGVVLVQQLRRTYLDLQDRLQVTRGKEVEA